ncbi:MAG TPA: hypothetical protein EYH45_02025 [Candidatus Caldiarchaeum subterraneum]|uniref:Flagellin n=1 Tax=Caldiarchaeum subterraneum TaxID=311458 RepID=A0A832ZVE1_CALS0|nr:hypothetical protein [Aigarchaeota archaeon]HIQ29323.1 hypothetical protein [Candidatus Caldarchaeum subterraneum]
MKDYLKMLVRRRGKKGLTGLETAIILIAFVIVASAFAFAVLNLGMFTTQKSAEAMQAGLQESLSSIEVAGAVIARVDTTTNKVANITIQIKSAVGKQPIDMSIGKLVIAYRDTEVFLENIYTQDLQTAGKIEVSQVTGDGDTVLEYGELWKIVIKIDELANLDPNEVFAVEIKPPIGSLLKVERRLPPAFDPVMDLT